MMNRIPLTASQLITPHCMNPASVIFPAWIEPEDNVRTFAQKPRSRSRDDGPVVILNYAQFYGRTG